MDLKDKTWKGLSSRFETRTVIRVSDLKDKIWKVYLLDLKCRPVICVLDLEDKLKKVYHLDLKCGSPYTLWSVFWIEILILSKTYITFSFLISAVNNALNQLLRRITMATLVGMITKFNFGFEGSFQFVLHPVAGKRKTWSQPSILPHCKRLWLMHLLKERTGNQ